MDAVFECAPMAGAIVDLTTGKLVAVNRVFVEVMGPLFKFAEMTFKEAGADRADRTALANALKAVQGGKREKVRNVKMLTRAGEAGLPVGKFFDWSLGFLEGAGGGETGSRAVLLGDLLTEADETQRAKDAELIDFFQNAPIALHWLSGTGHVVWANQTELDALGYTAEEYIGQPIMKFCPDEEELVLEIFKQLGSGNSIKDVPVRFRTKSGKIVPLLIDSNVNYTATGEFNHTRCFIRDDTGRRVREAKTELVLSETKRSLAMLDAFMQRTMHILRTPVAVALNDIEELRLKLADSSKGDAAETPATLLARSKRMIEAVRNITTDVADVATMERGAKPQIDLEMVKLSDIGHDAMSRMRENPLHGPDVKCRFETNASDSEVKTDPAAIGRVLGHLLRNAAQATARQGSKILLRIDYGDAGVTFAVEDDGPGLKGQEDANVNSGVFQRHVHSHKLPDTTKEGPEEVVAEVRSEMECSLKLSSGKEGLGIGLNLAYNLLHCLGTELYHSSGVGKATRFWFTLPCDEKTGASISTGLEDVASGDSAAVRDPMCRGGSIFRTNLMEAVASGDDLPEEAARLLQPPTAASMAQEGLAAMPQPHVVLVAEDSPLCAKMLEKTIKRAGYVSEWAINGEIAVQKLRNNPDLYSIVLMDLRMPVMDGIEATKAIRKTLELDIPIVAVTSETGFDVKQECLSSGFNDFCSKPLNLKKLVDVFGQHIVTKPLPAVTPDEQPKPPQAVTPVATARQV